MDEIHGTLGAGGSEASAPLQRLLAAVRAGQDVTDLLDAVHAAVQAAGDALGVYGQAGHRGLDAVGVESLEIVYRCPLRVCSGWDESDAPQFPPRCSISGQELPREYLD
ncbi:hypothetical protein ACFWY6_29940 [Streptomyces sp. NPDC059037]|uniref:hypothetical protein n=1 Tax=Streptomyces sp. NPDC059037 TaxID=3346710 RepID=UPI0036CFF1BA